jgi:tetratricopeptide (TPR) repeat protein
VATSWRRVLEPEPIPQEAPAGRRPAELAGALLIGGLVFLEQIDDLFPAGGRAHRLTWGETAQGGNRLIRPMAVQLLVDRLGKLDRRRGGRRRLRAVRRAVAQGRDWIDQLARAAADGVVVRTLLAGNLCHLGRYAEAELALAEARALAIDLGNQLDLLRVDWLQGTAAAGLGRTAEAIDALGRVRAAFIAQDNAYDAALVTLELAEVYAALGRTAEVKALARESAPVFQAQRVHREARQALELFRRAAEEERVSAELVRGVVTYLYRSRHDARVRFQRPA